MSEDTKTSLRKRHFQPDVPEPLLAQCKSDGERWMYQQQSIQRQQNEAILDRLEYGDQRFDQADRERDEMKRDIKATKESVTFVSNRVEVFEKFKERMTAKWTVIAFIFTAIVGPIILAFVAAAAIRFFEKLWK